MKKLFLKFIKQTASYPQIKNSRITQSRRFLKQLREKPLFSGIITKKRESSSSMKTI